LLLGDSDYYPVDSIRLSKRLTDNRQEFVLQGLAKRLIQMIRRTPLLVLASVANLSHFFKRSPLFRPSLRRQRFALAQLSGGPADQRRRL